MQRRIHMHDQVFNKVDDIMNHYHRRSMGGFVRVLRQLIRQASVI